MTLDGKGEPHIRLRSRTYFLARWFGIAAVCYIGVIIVMLLLENWLLFHPIRATTEWLAPPNSRVQDVELHTSDGTLIHAWWCPKEHWEPTQGALLYCHGNAGNLSHRSYNIARWQEHMDISVLIFDYPGYGRSEGKPSEAGCYAAADAAYDWLTTTMNVAPGQVLIYGGSLGAGMAVDLACRRPYRALVLVSAFTSIPDMAQKLYPWLPARWLVRNQFDNLAKVGKCDGRIFVAHGTADSLTPFTQGKQLFAAARDPKEFFPLQGCDHNDALGPEFFTALRQFLAKVEDGKPEPSAVANRRQATN
jgi:fermentation-respiration switch protein FrsA (DUF1100 family)